MSTFQKALNDWLGDPANTQAALADAIGTKQASISRYADGKRFPDAATARRIDEFTGGRVPFNTWQADFLSRAGLDSSFANERGQAA